MSVDFDFSGEQYALREVARDLFEKEFSSARLRDLWKGADRDPRMWKMLAEVGILGIAVPEKYGGFGGTALDLALVLEEAGRAGLPEPLVETALVGATIIAAYGSESDKEQWLPKIAAGDAVVSIALDSSPFCVDAGDADVVVARRGWEVFLLAKGSFTATSARSMDLARRIFALEFAPSGDTLLSSEPEAASRLTSLAAAGAASVLNGVGLRLVEMTREYVSARKQFGKPVGSFQAVAHKVADMHVAVESSRAAAWYAAYADAFSLPDAAAAASVAKAQAGTASNVVNREALQCHGGIGFTWEHDLHFWLKRGIALEHAYGSAAEHRTLLVTGLFGA